MKKILTMLTMVLMVGNYSFAQSSDDEGFVRKGRFLIETGYNIVGVYSSSTGTNLIMDFDGGTVSALGGDVGIMLTNSFALKFKLGLLTGGNDLNLTTLSAGAKLYAGGVVPIELTAGILDRGPASSHFTANLRVGYAARLAPNITLEPTVGMQILSDEAVLNFGINFGLFL